MDSYALAVLVFARLLGVLSAAPAFAARQIPFGVRFAAAAVLCPVLAGVAGKASGPIPEGAGPLAVLAAKELGVGLGLGFLAGLMLYGVAMAGSLASRQAGLSIGTAFDPGASSLGAGLASFYYLLAALVFLLVDGHHWLLAGLAESFQRLPVSVFLPPASGLQAVGAEGARMFVIAVLVGAPPMLALFITDVALAAASRVVPAFAPVAAAMPLRCAVGLAAVALSLPLLASVVAANLANVYQSLLAFVGAG